MAHLNRIDKKTLRYFYSTSALVFAAIGTVFLMRHQCPFGWLYALAGLFLALQFIGGNLALRFYILWMKIFYLLGFVNSIIILFVIFYGIITPVAVVMRLFGRDPLDKKIEKNRQTYWEKNESPDRSAYWEKNEFPAPGKNYYEKMGCC